MAEESPLTQTLAKLRGRIAQKKGQHLNEQDTKATLIEPVLRALGWDVEDDEEVRREYRRKGSEKPVDYGLHVQREPRLLVEAKAFGENLDDPRWANQIMGYAGVVGVGWIVLTNGDEYKIYNTHVPVRVEEKLFRSVRVSDEGSRARETLELLAKDQMSAKRIDELWNAQFVDRKVKAALERLIREGGAPLLKILTGQLKPLTRKEIQASLRRCRPDLDFPPPADSATRRVAGSTRSKKRGPSGGGKAVSVKDLLDAGILRAPVELEREYKKKRFTAQIEADGSVSWQGKKFESLSTAAGAARASVRGRRPDGSLPATNGWTFWKTRDGGELVEVDVFRQRHVARDGSALRAVP